MVTTTDLCCDNQNCQYFGQHGLGNIAIRAKYGKNKEHELLYCKKCGVSFSASRKTPLFKAHLDQKNIRDIISLSSQGMGVRGIAEHLGISPKAVNHNIIKIGELCAEQLANSIVSLDLVEVQLDEFWSFIKKNTLKRIPHFLTIIGKVPSGSGRR
jgi:protein-arginine kinase activator protein McsA